MHHKCWEKPVNHETVTFDSLLFWRRAFYNVIWFFRVNQCLNGSLFQIILKNIAPVCQINAILFKLCNRVRPLIHIFSVHTSKIRSMLILAHWTHFITLWHNNAKLHFFKWYFGKSVRKKSGLSFFRSQLYSSFFYITCFISVLFVFVANRSSQEYFSHMETSLLASKGFTFGPRF